MSQILVVKQINENPLQNLLDFDLNNVSHFEMQGNYKCESPRDLADLYFKYKMPIITRVDFSTLKLFRTFSQINNEREHIWFHTDSNKNYDALLRILKIKEIIKDDSIS